MARYYSTLKPNHSSFNNEGDQFSFFGFTSKKKDFLRPVFLGKENAKLLLAKLVDVVTGKHPKQFVRTVRESE